MSDLPKLPDYWCKRAGPRRWCPYCQEGIAFAKTWPPAHNNVVNKRASPNTWKRCWWINPRAGDRKARKAIERGAKITLVHVEVTP
jgi:hypothetical protein